MHDVSPAPTDSTEGADVCTNVPQELLDAYPPVSPNSASSVMGQYQDMDETIRGVAYGLINTVHKRTIGYEIARMEANARIKDRDEEIAGLQVRLAQLEGSIDAYARPEGFSDNDGRIDRLIPLGNGLLIPAKWVRQRTDTTVELLAGREEGEQRYVVELYATPNYALDTPAEPTPVWLLQLLRGPGDAYLTLMDAVEKLCDWPLEAEVYRYREVDNSRRELMARRDAICAELDLEEQRLAACLYRLEASRLADRVKNLEGRPFPRRHSPQMGRSSRGKKPRIQFANDSGESF
jgi:hypothetical protein